jgi:hypothetical protein
VFLPWICCYCCFIEYWDATGTIPEANDCLKCMEYIALDPNDPTNKDKIAMAMWYYDRFLPVAVGRAYYDEKVRYYKLLTDKINILGKQKVICPVITEAYGLLNLDNYRPRWLATFEWQKHDSKKSIPNTKDDPHIDKFKTRWTDPYSGRVKYAGWDPEAFDMLEHYKDELKKQRKADKDNGKKGQKKVLEMVRKAHNVVQEAPGKKSKRKKKDKGAPTTQQTKRIKRSNDDDEE